MQVKISWDWSEAGVGGDSAWETATVDQINDILRYAESVLGPPTPV